MLKLKPISHLAAIAVTLSAGAMYGQTDSAQLAGTVTDSTGAVVPNASIYLKNTATGFERNVKASASGAYTLPGLPIGNYAITVSAPGFGTYKSSITLNVGAQSVLDAKLGATADQTVTVESADEASQVNLSTQETSTIITTKQIVDLPTLTRNPYDFVVLSGSAAADPNGSTARGVGVALNGQRSSGTEILLDGVENADAYDATVGQPIPEDSVQEYRVIVNGFDAQYGRASGGIVNLATKSGTNRFHGSAYEFNRISALAANTYNEDAQNFANRAAGLPNNPQDHFTRNQFGYSVGGPALRDKLFFFNNYEFNRVRSTGSQIYEIPSAAFIAASSAQTQAFFKQYGTLAPGSVLGPTEAVAGYIGANPLQQVTVSAPIDAGAGDPINSIFGVSRVDFNISNKVSMYFRAATFKDTYFPGHVSLSPYNGFNTSQADFNQSYLFNLNYVLTPNLISSSKVSFSRVNISQPLGTAGIVPSLYLNQANVASRDANGTTIALPGYLPDAPGGALPFGGPANTYQFLEDMSYTKGKHTIKFGGQFLQIRDNRTFGAYQNAVELITKSGTSIGTDKANPNGTPNPSALTQLQAGNIYSFAVAINPQGKLPCSFNAAGTLNTTAACQITLPAAQPSFERQNTFNDGNWYVEDQWKATPRLTLNAGIRWEYYGVQHNHNPNVESNFFRGTGTNLVQQIASGQVATTPNSPVGGLTKKNLNNYAPRVGFAFDPAGNGKWAIRGGYGISYERNFGNVTYNVIQNPPAYAVTTLTAPTGAPATYQLTSNNLGPFAGTGTPVPFNPPSLRALQQDMPTALTHQYSMTVEHEIANNDLLQVYYSGARGEHLYAIAGVNGVGYGSLNGVAGGYGVNRINHQYAAINLREANADSHYDALNVALKANNYTRYGLQLTVNYTYSHALDNLSSTFSESGNNFNLGYLNPFNPRLDYGNADFDTRHRMTIGGIYEPSFLEFKSSRLLHTALGGLEFAPIATVRSGTPFSVYDCTNAANACPRVVAAAGTQFHGAVTPNGGVNSYDYLNIPAAAANPFVNSQGYSDFPDQLGGFQNSGIGRNQFFNPNNVVFDAGVYKNFNLGLDNRYKVQVRGEFYNVLNHHNYYALAGAADVSSGITNVGAVKGSPSDLLNSSDERRNVQLAIRLEF